MAVLLMLAPTAAFGASLPIKPNEYASYPVACGRSLALSDPNLGTYEYHVFGPINACMSAEFRSFASAMAPLVRPLQIATITVHLNSPGGSFADALAMVEATRYLKSAGARIRAVVDGQVRGAALWMFAQADERYISEQALVVFEYPYERPRQAIWWPRGQVDNRSRTWLETVADGLGIPLDELEALFDQRAVLYGYEVIQRRWAKSTQELKVPDVLIIPVPRVTPQALGQP